MEDNRFRHCASLILPSGSDRIPFTTVKELCFTAISQFCPHHLQNHMRKASHLAIKSAQMGPHETLPPEAQYADELYHCLHKVTNEKCIVHLELSYTNAGRIDFFLKDNLWGIELLREGDRLQEHLDRFKGKGKYGSWKLVKDWVTLDFRHSDPGSETILGKR